MTVLVLRPDYIEIPYPASHLQLGYGCDDGLDLHLRHIVLLRSSNAWLVLYRDEIPERRIALTVDENYEEQRCGICKKVIIKITEHYEDSLYSLAGCEQEGNGHRFHRKCLKRYLVEKTKDDLMNLRTYKVHCPNVRCGAVASAGDAKTVLGRKKYAQRKLRAHFDQHLGKARHNAKR